MLRYIFSWHSIYKKKKKIKDPGENTMKLESFSQNIVLPNILQKIKAH